MRALWASPGPAAFLARIQDAADDGNVLLALLPRGGSAEFRPWLRERDPGGRDWEPVTVRKGADPLVALHRNLLDQAESPTGAVQALVRAESLTGRRFWIEIPEGELDRWAGLLQDLPRAARGGGDPSLRPNFLFVHRGAAKAPPCRQDAGLKVFLWDRILTPLDLKAFGLLAYPRIAGRGAAGVLRLATAAEIAAFDPETFERLLDDPPRSFATLQDMLRGLAQERGWDPAEAPAWERGSLHGGTCHPALLSMPEGAPELRTRIWRAQVEVVFPLLERARHHLVQEAGHLLSVPVVTPGGTIHRVDELELGSIHYQLARRSPPAPAALVRRARILKAARNDLAHLDPLDESFLAELLPLIEGGVC